MEALGSVHALYDILNSVKHSYIIVERGIFENYYRIINIIITVEDQ